MTCHRKTSQLTLSPTNLACRFGFAYDIEIETQKIQADIHRMQQQLQLFDYHTDATSAHVQKHAVDPNSPAQAVQVQDGSVPAPALLTPFLFVGVLSVAGNAGIPNNMPFTCHNIVRHADLSDSLICFRNAPLIHLLTLAWL